MALSPQARLSPTTSIYLSADCLVRPMCFTDFTNLRVLMREGRFWTGCSELHCHHPWSKCQTAVRNSTKALPPSPGFMLHDVRCRTTRFIMPYPGLQTLTATAYPGWIFSGGPK